MYSSSDYQGSVCHTQSREECWQEHSTTESSPGFGFHDQRWGPHVVPILIDGELPFHFTDNRIRPLQFSLLSKGLKRIKRSEALGEHLSPEPSHPAELIPFASHGIRKRIFLAVFCVKLLGSAEAKLKRSKPARTKNQVKCHTPPANCGSPTQRYFQQTTPACLSSVSRKQSVFETDKLRVHQGTGWKHFLNVSQVHSRNRLEG